MVSGEGLFLDYRGIGHPCHGFEHPTLGMHRSGPVDIAGQEGQFRIGIADPRTVVDSDPAHEIQHAGAVQIQDIVAFPAQPFR